jgi:hypothetical protein
MKKGKRVLLYGAKYKAFIVSVMLGEKNLGVFRIFDKYKISHH